VKETSERSAAPTQPPFQQNRQLRVAFSRHKYIGQAFHVVVNIGDNKLTALNELAKKLKPERVDRLSFDAQEASPQVQVELQFAAGEFIANRRQDSRPLLPDRQTDFGFLVKPLKAEDCILTVVISYVTTQTIAEHPAQRTELSEDVTNAAGQETSHEQSVETVITLATTATQITPLWTADLVVSVKQIFGMNASTLSAVRALLGIVFAALIVGVGVVTKKTDILHGGLVIGLALLTALGAPVYDVAKTLMTKIV
jgi:hypothetical protein